MGCSKQAVTDWVKSGRIIVGADGRIDPRQAVSKLLATSNPARLRARVLAPLVGEIDGLRKRLVSAESACAAYREDAEFYERSANELVALVESLQARLIADLEALRDLPIDLARSAVAAWIGEAEMTGIPASSMLAYVPAASEIEEATDELL